MKVQIGTHTFDDVLYDDEADVLYLSIGPPAAASAVDETPEGHAVRMDAEGTVIGITLVNPRWLLERDGKVTITMPEPIETSAEELADALTGV